MNYTSGGHTVFQHRYHIVWITRCRYKVLEGALRNGYERLSGRSAKNSASRSSPAFCRENMSICSWKSRRILRSATSCGGSRDAHHIGCRWSSLDGVPGLAQALLGTAFLGARLLLHHERQPHGRCHTSVSSGARTYWHQPATGRDSSPSARARFYRRRALL